MSRFSTVAKALIRFVVVWAVDALSLMVTARLFPGISIAGATFFERLTVAFGIAFLLGLVNLLVRPMILLVARPLGFFAVFGIGFFINAASLMLTAWILPGFEIGGVVGAFVAGIVFSAVNVVLTGILDVDEEGSFYQGLIERQARKQQPSGASEPGRGLVMIEIDGLSVHHLQKALADGIVPNLQRMIDEEGYVVSRVDCGIPSQTSACQAGILFGDNHDIPAFRWYDKDEGKLYVSSKDAAALNARYASGNGLLRRGTSIDNMLDGDAEKSLLTVSNLRSADPEEARMRAEDISLLMLNPYFLMRTVALFFADAAREVWGYLGDRRRDVWPRLNRLAHGYPFLRAGTTVFVRDIAGNLTILDIIRGVPAIYVTWPGYDEVAHHSGPWSSDAFGVLARFDPVIGKVREAIRTKAPRSYDLIVLSDHGQSFGATFKQRYGVTLKELIESLLPAGTTVAQSMGGDTGAPSLDAVAAELGNAGASGQGGRLTASAATGIQAALEQRRESVGKATGEQNIDAPAQVTAYGSGNLAQVYFDLLPRKITLPELEEAYPGMVEQLVAHEGIGLVCGYDENGVPVALGKEGSRNLHTGDVVGEDPVEPYAPQEPGSHGEASIDTRVWQLRRVMDFPHAGDLMVISTVYPDGTVAALEELIGNHGGVGGEQTDAFVLHPPDMEVPPTRNSIDLFPILDAQRGKPPRPESAQAPLPEGERPWTRSNLVQGLAAVSTWLPRAARAMILDRSAYREVAADPLMTSPGLLLGVVFAALGALARQNQPEAVGPVARAAGWLVAALLVYGAGRLLSRKGTYTRTMRTLGFAQVAHIVDVLVVFAPLAPFARIASTLLVFFGSWMAAVEAHEMRGWRTVMLPVIVIVLLVVVPLVVTGLIGGTVTGVEGILQHLGVAPQ